MKISIHMMLKYHMLEKDNYKVRLVNNVNNHEQIILLVIQKEYM